MLQMSRFVCIALLVATSNATSDVRTPEQRSCDEWIEVEILEGEPSQELQKHVADGFGRARFIGFWHRPPRSTGPAVRRADLEEVWSYQLTYRCPASCERMQTLPSHLRSGLRHAEECPPPFSTRMVLFDGNMERIAEFDFQSSGHCFVSALGSYFTEASVFDLIDRGPRLPKFLR